MPTEIIAIAADHAGFDLKEILKDLAEMGFQVLDLGTDGPGCRLSGFRRRLARAVEDGPAGRGVLVCGTGIGIAIAANRHRTFARGALPRRDDARLAREHNDANVLALGARMIGAETAKDCLRTFLATEFEGGRHERRVDKMS